MDNQPMTDEPLEEEMLVEGTTVFDVEGEKVGTLSAEDAEAGCLIVQKGWLFPHELYVPFTCITNHDDSGIFLSLSKQELKEDRWKTPPDVADMAADSDVGQPVGMAPQASGPGADWGKQSDEELSQPEEVDQPEVIGGPQTNWGQQPDSDLSRE